MTHLPPLSPTLPAGHPMKCPGALVVLSVGWHTQSPSLAGRVFSPWSPGHADAFSAHLEVGP